MESELSLDSYSEKDIKNLFKYG